VDYYGDGYYLFNRRYPGDRIAISFYLNKGLIERGDPCNPGPARKFVKE